MKVVINRSFGGFSLPQWWLDQFGFEEYDDVDRSDQNLINDVENGFLPELVVVEIPDSATDKLLTEYDGAETIYYVLDGKIYEA